VSAVAGVMTRVAASLLDESLDRSWVSVVSASRKKTKGPRMRGPLKMELAGLEPATSWVRSERRHSASDPEGGSPYWELAASDPELALSPKSRNWRLFSGAETRRDSSGRGKKSTRGDRSGPLCALGGRV
jgi:hypothetical protein